MAGIHQPFKIRKVRKILKEEKDSSEPFRYGAGKCSEGVQSAGLPGEKIEMTRLI
jgi:hypothetical protein